jgi:hypothetical protein
MVEIEYAGKKLNVPQNWDDITLGLYEQIYALKPDTARDRVALVAKVCSVDTETLLSWPAEIFNIIVSHIMFLYGDHTTAPSPVVEIAGVKYIVPIEDELSLGAWVDADEAQKTGVTSLSTTLAIVCRPAGEDYNYKNNEARRIMFAAQPVSKVLGVMAFFLHCRTVSEQRTKAFGNLQKMADQLPRSTEILRNLGTGTKLLRTWRIMRFYILTELLRYRLRKFSHSYNTAGIKTTRKAHKGN